MTSGRDGIRVAAPAEYPRLREIEEEADRMFLEIGMAPFAVSDEENHLAQAAVVLVCGDPAVGFACVDVVDGEAHLWQVSVLPSHGRRGLGRALVESVCAWARQEGYPSVTLTTFRDVPWNGPFYSSMGFHVVDDLPPGLQQIREHERAVGDDALGVRVAMRKPLAPYAP